MREERETPFQLHHLAKRHSWLCIKRIQLKEAVFVQIITIFIAGLETEKLKEAVFVQIITIFIAGLETEKLKEAVFVQIIAILKRNVRKTE